MTTEPPAVRGHAFLSYVHEDADAVDLIDRSLTAAGVPVWRDVTQLMPGEDWRMVIRRAIVDDALAFVACFSDSSRRRAVTHHHEELLLAVDQLRLRSPEHPWLVPVRLSDCTLPPFEIGGGRTLDSLQRVDLFGPGRRQALDRLVTAVRRILEPTP